MALCAPGCFSVSFLGIRLHLARACFALAAADRGGSFCRPIAHASGGPGGLQAPVPVSARPGKRVCVRVCKGGRRVRARACVFVHAQVASMLEQPGLGCLCVFLEDQGWLHYCLEDQGWPHHGLIKAVNRPAAACDLCFLQALRWKRQQAELPMNASGRTLAQDTPRHAAYHILPNK